MKTETIAGLDIGTTKTCAVVATPTPGGLSILGIGEAPSAGLRRGIVTDLEETVKSIEAATERAERMAGVHISHVYVGVTGEHVQSTNNRGVVAVTGDEHEVVAGDVRRVLEASKLIDLGTDRQIIHALPRGFAIDGHGGVTDPVGMSGTRLEVETHIVTGGSSFIANVLKCVHRAGLEPAGIVFEPLASSAATLAGEEKQVGVALLDIGGGTTDIAVYSGGGAIHTATLPIGGNVLTSDIAFGLRTSIGEAEHVKRTQASARHDLRDRAADFPIKTLDGRPGAFASAQQLRSIVVPRIAEIFQLAKAHIAEHSPRDLVLAEIVLTGGGARLDGIETVAADCFGLPVRVGLPGAVSGLTEAVRQPEYATAVGLVLFGPRGEDVVWNGRRRNPFSRFSGWLGDLWN